MDDLTFSPNSDGNVWLCDTKQVVNVSKCFHNVDPLERCNNMLCGEKQFEIFHSRSWSKEPEHKLVGIQIQSNPSSSISSIFMINHKPHGWRGCCRQCNPIYVILPGGRRTTVVSSAASCIQSSVYHHPSPAEAEQQQQQLQKQTSKIQLDTGRDLVRSNSSKILLSFPIFVALSSEGRHPTAEVWQRKNVLPHGFK